MKKLFIICHAFFIAQANPAGVEMMEEKKMEQEDAPSEPIKVVLFRREYSIDLKNPEDIKVLIEAALAHLDETKQMLTTAIKLISNNVDLIRQKKMSDLVKDCNDLIENCNKTSKEVKETMQSIVTEKKIREIVCDFESKHSKAKKHIKELNIMMQKLSQKT